MYPTDPDSKSDASNQKPSLLVEIGRGWEWVVFSIKVLSRVGGPVEIAKTIGNSVKILAIRTLKQWGVGGK